MKSTHKFHSVRCNLYLPQLSFPTRAGRGIEEDLCDVYCSVKLPYHFHCQIVSGSFWTTRGNLKKCVPVTKRTKPFPTMFAGRQCNYSFQALRLMFGGWRTADTVFHMLLHRTEKPSIKVITHLVSKLECHCCVNHQWKLLHFSCSYAILSKKTLVQQSGWLLNWQGLPVPKVCFRRTYTSRLANFCWSELCL